MCSSHFVRFGAIVLTLTLGACGGGGGGARTTNPGTGGDDSTGDGGSSGSAPTGGSSGGGKQDASPSQDTGGSTGSGGSTATGGSGDTGGSTGTGGAGDTGGMGDTGGVGGSGPPPPPPTEDLPPCKKTIPVPNSGALGGAISAAMPGDCLVLADGNYTLPAISGKKGTADAPIVIKAANTLNAVAASGGFSISDSAYLVVQGIMYTGNTGAKVSNCDHCRVSRCQFKLQDGGFDTFTVSGTSVGVRVDHNDFGPKTVLGNTIMLAGAGPQIVQQTRLDHNYFHDVSGGAGNGWETIRAGLSGWWLSSSKTVIEYNLFERCTGDPETISIKSSDNTIRYNTMRNNHGEMTLRHGNRQIVYGNWLLGNDSGMRVCGGLHKIYNNYVGNMTGKGIFLEGGENNDMGGAPTDHKQVYGVQVLFNTIVSSQGIAVGGGHPMQPKDCIVANNLLQGGAMLSQDPGATNITYSNNFVNGGASVNSPGAVKMVDPKLVKMGEIFRFGADSPAIDAADPKYSVMDDIDGNARTGKLDVGADEFSMGGPMLAPLTTKDVGPASP
jgi:hypothetical protein